MCHKMCLSCMNAAIRHVLSQGISSQVMFYSKLSSPSADDCHMSSLPHIMLAMNVDGHTLCMSENKC